MIDRNDSPESKDPIFGDPPTERTQAPTRWPVLFGWPWPASGRRVPPETSGMQESSVRPRSRRPTDLLTLLALLVLAAITGFSTYLAFSTRRAVEGELARKDEQLEQITRQLAVRNQKQSEVKTDLPVVSDELPPRETKLANPPRRANGIRKDQRGAGRPIPRASEPNTDAEEPKQLHDDLAVKSAGVVSGRNAVGKGEEPNRITVRVSEMPGMKLTRVGSEAEELIGNPDPSQEERRKLEEQIVRSREELMELTQRTQRDHFEFHLDRKGAEQQIGPLRIELRKVYSKGHHYTVRLTCTEGRRAQWNKALHEPIYFYLQGFSLPFRLVVDRFDGNGKGLSGYLEAPSGFLLRSGDRCRIWKYY